MAYYISWFHPPPSPWGDLQVLEPKMMGEKFCFFQSWGDLGCWGSPNITVGLSILREYHYAISTKVDQKIHVYQYCERMNL